MLVAVVIDDALHACYFMSVRDYGVGSNDLKFWVLRHVRSTHDFLLMNHYFQPCVAHSLHHDIPYDIQICLQLQ